MRALFLTHDYAPVGGGGVQRPLHLVRALVAAGHHVHVIAVDKDPGKMRDETLLERHPSQVPITRYRLPSVEPVVNLFRRAHLSRVPSLVLPPDLYVDASIFFRVTVRAALEVGRAFRPDVVIASAPPFGIFEAGRRVASELKATLVLDMRDPGVEPLTGRLPSRVSLWWGQALQRPALATADLVVVTAPTLRDLLEKMPVGRPRAVIAVTNGFDAEVFIDAATAEKGRQLCAGSGNGMRSVVFAGRLFTSDTRTPSRLGAVADRIFNQLAVGPEIMRGGDYNSASWFQALTILAERRADLWGKLQTVFIGDIPPQGQGFPRAQAAFPVRHCGYQPVAVAAAAMRAADGLLLFNLSTSDDSPSFVIHGKLFEYLAAGPPIFGLCGPGDCADIIRATGGGVWVHDRHPEEMAIALERWLSNEPLSLVRDPQLIAQYSRLVLGRRFVAGVEGAVAAHSARSV